MITAKEARELLESKQAFDKKVKEFLVQLNDKIIERCNDGCNSCWLECTDTDVRDAIEKNMTDLGYRVTITGPYHSGSDDIWRLGIEW